MSSWEANQIVDKYMLAKRLPLGERSPALVDRLLGDAGLIDDPELLLQLEITNQEAVRGIEQQNEAKKLNLKRNRNSGR